MPAPVFPRGGVSSRAARTGRSRSGSADRLSQSPPRASRSGRSRSAAERARRPARPVLRRSLSGALFSGTPPSNTAGCAGRRGSASRIPGRPLPASRRARRLSGTQKRQPKTSCLFSMRKARTTARGMTFYVEGIFEYSLLLCPPSGRQTDTSLRLSLCGGSRSSRCHLLFTVCSCSKIFPVTERFYLTGFSRPAQYPPPEILSGSGPRHFRGDSLS